MGVERSVLHHHDHDGRRKNRRQHRILETICQVLRSHNEVKGAFDANRYRLHVNPQLSFALSDATVRCESVRSEGGAVTRRVLLGLQNLHRESLFHPLCSPKLSRV